MLNRQIHKVGTATGVIGLVLVAAMGSMPAPAHAAEIAWHATSELTHYCPPAFTREGTAVFETGEKADLVIHGTIYVPDAKGTMPYKAEYVLQFENGSTITFRVAGRTDSAAGTNGGSGEFVFGTGAFDGIAGTVAVIGQAVDTSGRADWTGSYSLPDR